MSVLVPTSFLYGACGSNVLFFSFGRGGDVAVLGVVDHLTSCRCVDWIAGVVRWMGVEGLS